jgi:uncharacterized protein (DUF2249 family)
LQQLGSTLVLAKKQALIVQTLKQFKVGKFSELTADQYPAVLEALKKL